MKKMSDSDWTRTQNHLVRKRTLKTSLAKWFSVRLRTKWFSIWLQMQSLKLQISRLPQARKHSDNYRVWIHSEKRTWHDKNIQLAQIGLQVPKVSFHKIAAD